VAKNKYASAVLDRYCHWPTLLDQLFHVAI